MAMRRRARGIAAPPAALRQAVLRAQPLEWGTVDGALSRAVRAAGPSAPHSLLGALHAAAIRAVGERRREDLLSPLVERARQWEGGRWLAYTAALGVVSRSPAHDRFERALRLIEAMRADGCKPSQLALQHLLRASGNSADPMDSMVVQMRAGLSPKLAAFNTLVGVYASCERERRAHASILASLPEDPNGSEVCGLPEDVSEAPGEGGDARTRAEQATAESDAVTSQMSVALLLQVMKMCSLKPNGRTLQELLSLANSPADIRAIGAYTPTPSTVRPQHSLVAQNAHFLHALFSASARVSSRLAVGTQLFRFPDLRHRMSVWRCSTNL